MGSASTATSACRRDKRCRTAFSQEAPEDDHGSVGRGWQQLLTTVSQLKASQSQLQEAVAQTVAAHNQLAAILQLERVRWQAVGLINVQLRTELFTARQAVLTARASSTSTTEQVDKES